jgi:hypothetical protein
MTMKVGVLIAAFAGVCVLGGTIAQAQEHKSETKITINDDGKRRHIVVERDGKVIRDEWVDSKSAKGDPRIFTRKDGAITYEVDGKTRTIRVGDGKGDYKIVGRGKVDLTTVTPGKDGTITIKTGDKVRTIKPGQGTTIVTDGKGGNRVETFMRGGVPGMPGAARGMVFSHDNMSRLIKSLTRDQKSKQDRQGYLTLDDLSPQQRSMFNAPKGGNWNIVFEVDGDKIILRGK